MWEVCRLCTLISCYAVSDTTLMLISTYLYTLSFGYLGLERGRQRSKIVYEDLIFKDFNYISKVVNYI